MSRYVGRYFEFKRNQQNKRRKRQKRNEAGLPVPVLMKKVSFSPEPSAAITAASAPAYREAFRRRRTPKGFAALTALALHLIAVLIAAHYVVFPS
ncbi:MAG: hypothetical protein O7E52_17730 [Candidatus Poribacteria bacterium]|nr:hypothetical protein [Candidatus Poribacteria bacterium]